MGKGCLPTILVVVTLTFFLVSVTIALPPPAVKGGCLCPTVHFPVCGTDKITHINLCTLECKMKKGYNVRFWKIGPCDKDKATYYKKNKKCDCPLVYKPVCGTNGGTFANQCVLLCEKVKSPDLDVKRQGPCNKPYYVKWMLNLRRKAHREVDETSQRKAQPDQKKPQPASKKAQPAPKKAQPASKKAQPAPKKAQPAPKKAKPAAKKAQKGQKKG